MSRLEDGRLWHALPVGEALADLGTARRGLTTVDAETRQREHGLNVIPRGRRESSIKILWRQINHPINYILLISTAVAIGLGKVIDGLVVLGAVVVNSVVGFFQEVRAGEAIQALITLIPEDTSVIRDGTRRRLPARELVPGDLIFVQSGDKVPADVRIVECKTLKVEEAALTGESVPVDKSPEPAPSEAIVADRRSMLYGGTLVRFGTATAVVTATGGATELGRISSLLEQTLQVETPLTLALSKVGNTLTWMILAVGAAMLAVALARGYGLPDATLAAVTLAVAAIPEGLPTIITVALALGIRRMAARHAIIRKLPAVETLGSTTVICTDKTGTLTRNEMAVREAWSPDGGLQFEGEGYSPVGRVSAPVTPGLRALLECGRLCNDTTLKKDDAGNWLVDGDPTEAALLVAAARAGVEESLRRIDEIPFESERQFMATLHQLDGARGLVLMKGAPEVVLARCSTVFGAASLDDRVVLDEVGRLGGRGMRVLAFAQKRLDHVPRYLSEGDLHGLELLGLQGMIDPPRPETFPAIEECHAAGITVKMITGDHATTAAAIARELDLIGTDGVLTGKELDAISDEDLRCRARQVNVFARVAPEHKLRLVRALQAGGEVVAMTGDGVNDGPALKQADIGIAMGISGTSVAKEAAKMVLTDDDFATIASAVEEGRRIFDNLIKSLIFVVPTNLGMALVLLVSVLLFPIVDGRPILPILPVQTLWINLVSGVTLAFGLTVEAAEPNLMQRPPRRQKDPLLSRAAVLRMVTVAAIMTAGGIGLFLYEYYVAVEHHLPEALQRREAQTMSVTAVVLFQIAYVLTCRSFSQPLWRVPFRRSRALLGGLLVTVLLQLGFIYLPPMNAVFGSVPLDLDAWVKSLATAVLIIPLVEVEKAVQRRRAKTGKPMQALRQAPN
jgi:Ca2+-transporting ATPase